MVDYKIINPRDRIKKTIKDIKERKEKEKKDKKSSPSRFSPSSKKNKKPKAQLDLSYVNRPVVKEKYTKKPSSKDPSRAGRIEDLKDLSIQEATRRGASLSQVSDRPRQIYLDPSRAPSLDSPIARLSAQEAVKIAASASKPTKSRTVYVGDTNIIDEYDRRSKIQSTEPDPITPWEPQPEFEVRGPDPIKVVEQELTRDDIRQRERMLSKSPFVPQSPGRITMGYGYGPMQGYQQLRGGIRENVIQDYAQRFFQKGQQTPIIDTGYQKAQKSVDKLFGADITSGKNFRKMFGDPIPQKKSRKRL